MSVSAAAGAGFWKSWAMPDRQKVQSGASSGQETSGAAAATGATAESGATAKRIDPVATFTELTKGTPEQRLFKAWLARHHLTQDEYDALPLDERKKLDEDFRKELEEQTRGGAATIRSVDIVV